MPWARELVRRGHEVTLLCVAEHDRWRTKETEEDGVVVVESPDLLVGPMRSGWDPWCTWNRCRYLRGRQFDLIHCFETRPATIHPVLRLLRRHPAPLVIDWNDWWGRGGLIKERRPRWYRVLLGPMETWYEEHFRARADHTTVISSALAERAARLGVPRESISIIRGGVDIHRFKPQDRLRHRDRLGIPRESFVVIFSAADATMDLDLALNAVRCCADPSVFLVITGRAPRDFDRQIQSMNLEKRVRHLGFLPYESLPDVLACADVFLLPFRNTVANRGRWPHKVGEYLACGRPTISNPTGDIRELFGREHVGVLADPTPQAMADALLNLKKNELLRLEIGHHARCVAEAQFAWPRIVDQVEHVYESLKWCRIVTMP